MSNKLFTEEQVRKALKIALGSTSIKTENDVIDLLTPIELPTNEEIEYKTVNLVNLEDWDMFKKGAKWMRNKIKEGKIK